MKRILWAALILLLPIVAKADLHPPPSGISITSTLQSGATFYVSSGTATNFNSSTATILGLVGTTTNNNANAGNYGEYLSSVAVNASLASATYSDLVSLTLTPGDWDVSLAVDINPGTTAGTLIIGLGTASGTGTTGLVAGDTRVGLGTGATSFSSSTGLALSGLRVSIATSTPYYFKVNVTYASSAQISGRMSARRIR